MELDYKAVGKRIKTARIKAELTQEQLAELCGISATHVSNIETGATRVSLTAILNIANALSITTDDILCDNLNKARIQFEKDIFEILNDCTDNEIRMIADIAQAIKAVYRRNKQ